MRCNMCGIKVSDYTDICVNCGAKLIKEENFLVNYSDSITKINENNKDDVDNESDKNILQENNTFEVLKQQLSDEQLRFLRNYRDKPSILLNIIGIISPLVAIIVAITQMQIYPKRSKSLIKWAIIGMVISIMLKYVIAPLLIELLIPNIENIMPNVDIPYRNHFFEIKVLIDVIKKKIFIV